MTHRLRWYLAWPFYAAAGALYATGSWIMAPVTPPMAPGHEERFLDAAGQMVGARQSGELRRQLHPAAPGGTENGHVPGEVNP